MDLLEIELMGNDVENIYAVATVVCYIKIIFGMHEYGDILYK